MPKKKITDVTLEPTYRHDSQSLWALYVFHPSQPAPYNLWFKEEGLLVTSSVKMLPLKISEQVITFVTSENVKTILLKQPHLYAQLKNITVKNTVEMM